MQGVHPGRQTFQFFTVIYFVIVIRGIHNWRFAEPVFCF
ncbi:MAG: hypothetical protein JWP81_19 [Ferruginibacter sp.]|nr:hypothetical protein [Ferruginibacter sp.]